MDKFKSYRKHKFRQMQQILDKDEDADLYDHEEEIMRHIDQLEDDLMNVEMKLSEALMQSTIEFQDKVKKIIEDMKAKTGSL